MKAYKELGLYELANRDKIMIENLTKKWNDYIII